MEELLNKLIEKGWKPRWLNIMWKIVIDYDIEFAFDIYDSLQKWHWNFRELVSKESWLWQFVCENGMIKEGHKHERILDPTFWEWWADCKRQEHDWNYWYRLIESALCDEDRLEDFILENITIKWTK